MENLNLWDSLTLQNEVFLNQYLAENFAIPNVKENKPIRIKKEKYTILFFDIKDSTQLLANDQKSVKKIFKFLYEVLTTMSDILKNKFEFKFVGDGILILTPLEIDNFKTPEDPSHRWRAEPGKGPIKNEAYGITSEDHIKIINQVKQPLKDKIYETCLENLPNQTKQEKKPLKENISKQDLSECEKDNLKILYNILSQNVNLDFRLVGGSGKLYCIEFMTVNGTLKECIGFPISCLVKLSKQINKCKWCGELTSEICKKKLCDSKKVYYRKNI